MTKFIRIGLTLLLLAVVWRYAHWSVALILTAMTVSNEFASRTYNRDRRYRAERSLVEYRLFKKLKFLTRRLEIAEKQTDYVHKSVQQLAAKQSEAKKEILPT